MSFSRRYRDTRPRQQTNTVSAADSRYHEEQKAAEAAKLHKQLIEEIEDKKKELEILAAKTETAANEHAVVVSELANIKSQLVTHMQIEADAKIQRVAAEESLRNVLDDIKEAKAKYLIEVEDINVELETRISSVNALLNERLEQKKLVEADILALGEKGVKAEDNLEILKQSITNKESEFQKLQDDITKLTADVSELQIKKKELADIKKEIVDKKAELVQISKDIETGRVEFKSFTEQSVKRESELDLKMQNIKSVEAGVDQKITIIKQFLGRNDVAETIKNKILNLQ